MIEVKCKGCNKLLAKASIFVGAVKCTRCKMIFEYRIYENNLYDNTTYGIKDTEPIEVRQ